MSSPRRKEFTNVLSSSKVLVTNVISSGDVTIFRPQTEVPLWSKLVIRKIKIIPSFGNLQTNAIAAIEDDSSNGDKGFVILWS